jgi:WD40 repeat protein
MTFTPDAELQGLLKADFGSYVAGCAFSSDGETVAYALGDGRLALFDPETGETDFVAAHTGAALCLAASPLGFISGGDDGRVLLTTPETGARELAAFPGQWVEHVAACATGRVLAAAVGKQVVLFTGDDLTPSQLPELPSTIAGLAASPDGRALAASHYDGVTVYAPVRPGATGNRLDGPGSNLTVVFSPDGDRMALATQDKSVRVYDLAQSAGYLLEGYPAKVRCLSFARDSEMLWTGGEQAFVGWPVGADIDPSTREAVVFGAFEHGMLGAVAAHPAMPLVAGGFDGGVVFLGSVDRRGAAPLFALESHRITCLSWSPDGRTLAGGSDGGPTFFMRLA